MYADNFESRIAIVRHRFATALESKIEDVAVSADRMFRGDDKVSELISESYRRLHGICGVGPTVGFPATSTAARAAEEALINAYREKRGLSEQEFHTLNEALVRLREAAATELQSMYERGR